MSDDKPTCFGSKPSPQAQAENDCYRCSWLYECHGDNDILDSTYNIVTPRQLEVYETLKGKTASELLEMMWKSMWRKS